MKYLIPFCFINFYFALFITTPSQAEPEGCIETIWINKKAKTGDLARISLREPCAISSYPQKIRLKIETKCYPRLCTWGWRNAFYIDSQTIRTTITTYAAERDIKINKLSKTLRAQVNNDYVYPGRPSDFKRATLFLKE